VLPSNSWAAQCGLVGTSRTISLKPALNLSGFYPIRGSVFADQVIQVIERGCNLARYLCVVAQPFGEAA
jgi:hypothetical protein